MHLRDENDKGHDFQIAPMVDVVFMLIIFFMLSAAIKQNEHTLGMKLPGTDGSNGDPIELTIREDGVVLWNELEVGPADDKELKDLQTRLEQARELFGEDQPVIIAPRPSVQHSRVIDVLNVCAAARMRSLSFAG